MSRLFVFGIGGTGSRVIRSLVMLLASGVKIEAEEIVPVIIDPDRSNGDLTRTVQVLRHYQRIHEQARPDGLGFFSTRITSLSQMDTANGQNPGSGQFLFTISDLDDNRFRDLLEFGQLDEANKALTGLLFSKMNLDAQMDVGFKGNPNIGSVVLNRFYNSREFRIFAANFREGDKIFIISSIFGGTGAAGFPLLVKNIRNAGPDIENHQLLRNAPIGAITLMPYFGVAKQQDSQIDKSSFFSKTRAALEYYYRNISGNNSVNTIYYIGDRIMKDYPNHEGASEQKNDAHFVEFASAMAIEDFARSLNGNKETVAKEYGLDRPGTDLCFSHISSAERARTEGALSGFYLFYLFQKYQIHRSVKQQPWAGSKQARIDKAFLKSGFYSSELVPFLEHFNQWLEELAGNRISFKPFHLKDEVIADQLFDTFLVNKVPERNKDPLHRNFWKLESALNKAARKVKTNNRDRRFLAVFNLATREVIEKHFKFQANG
jgi:hypothetical protein